MYPSIIEKTGRSSRSFDLPTKLLEDRIVYMSDVLDDEQANYIIMQMLWLNADSPEKDINLYINSPGGIVTAGLAIKDIMYNLDCKVNTVGLGQCASMGAYILSAGTGTRKVTKNCRVMIHSVSGGSIGNVKEMQIAYEETQKLHDKMITDMSSFTKGKCSLEEIKEMVKNDYYMSSDEALALGFVDCII